MNLIFDAPARWRSRLRRYGLRHPGRIGLRRYRTQRHQQRPDAFDGSAAGNVRMTMGMVGLACQRRGCGSTVPVNEADHGESGGTPATAQRAQIGGGICVIQYQPRQFGKSRGLHRRVNRGNLLSTKSGPRLGIVAAANRYTHHGVHQLRKITSTHSPYRAMHVSATSPASRGPALSSPSKVVNHGDVIFAKRTARQAVSSAFVNHETTTVVDAKNYGRVISDRATTTTTREPSSAVQQGRLVPQLYRAGRRRHVQQRQLRHGRRQCRTTTY